MGDHNDVVLGHILINIVVRQLDGAQAIAQGDLGAILGSHLGQLALGDIDLGHLAIVQQQLDGIAAGTVQAAILFVLQSLGQVTVLLVGTLELGAGEVGALAGVNIVGVHIDSIAQGVLGVTDLDLGLVSFVVLHVATGGVDDLSVSGDEHTEDGVVLVRTTVVHALLAILEDDLHFLADEGDVQIGGDVVGSRSVLLALLVIVEAGHNDLAGLGGVVGLVVSGEGADHDLGVITLLEHHLAAAVAPGHLTSAGVGAGGHPAGGVLQAVPDQLGSHVTAGRSGHDHAGQLIVEGGIGLTGQLIGTDSPGGAGQTVSSGIVAQGGQDHLGGLQTGHIGAGIESAIAAAADDTQIIAVLDVALGPVALDVGKAGGTLYAGVGVGAAVHSNSDHLGHLGTGHVPGGIEVAAVILAVDDIEGNQNVDGIVVHDFIGINEVRRAGANRHHTNEHDAGQSQAQNALEVVHVLFPPFYFGRGVDSVVSWGILKPGKPCGPEGPIPKKQSVTPLIRRKKGEKDIKRAGKGLLFRLKGEAGRHGGRLEKYRSLEPAGAEWVPGVFW